MLYSDEFQFGIQTICCIKNTVVQYSLVCIAIEENMCICVEVYISTVHFGVCSYIGVMCINVVLYCNTVQFGVYSNIGVYLYQCIAIHSAVQCVQLQRSICGGPSAVQLWPPATPWTGLAWGQFGGLGKTGEELEEWGGITGVPNGEELEE